MRKREHRKEGKRVVVVGAGIAGLTAAHELVERGFEVEVVEADFQPTPTAASLDERVSAIAAAANLGALANEALPTRVETLLQHALDSNKVLTPREQQLFAPDAALDRALISANLSAAVLALEGIYRKQLAGQPSQGTHWTPRVGGMARTQWAVAPVPPERMGHRVVVREEGARLVRLSPVRLPAPVTFSMTNEPGPLGPLPNLEVFGRAVYDAKLGNQSLVVTVERRDWDEVLEKAQTAFLVAKLQPRFSGEDGRGDPEQQQQQQRAPVPVEELAVSHVQNEDLDPGTIRVSVVIRHDQYPAEHGFRFFPSFYLHLFDSMKRTPLRRVRPFSRGRRQPAWRQDSTRTAFDNLVTAESARFGLDAERYGGQSFSVARRPAKTVTELLEVTRSLLEDAGYDGKSVARLGTVLIQYLTSSEARRRGELERITWEQFVKGRSGHTFDPRLELHLVAAPQALAAMSASKNDARTIAYIALQLILDQFRDSGYSDGTLNGPTSESWLWHWEDYLRSQGVKFTAGRLVGFEKLGPKDGPFVVRPVVLERHGEPDARGDDAWRRVQLGDYTVITAPVDKVYEVIDRPDDHGVTGVTLIPKEDLLSLSESWTGQAEQDELAKFVEFIEHVPDQDGTALDVLTREKDAGPLRWMVGIQFYFESDVRFIKGHTMCSDSPWGVSYISQAQYWTQKPRYYDGYRGVISAIFTRFDADGLIPAREGQPARKARDCTADQIAREVWEQIRVTLSPEEQNIGEPLHYYIDENVKFDGANGRVVDNETPYLVNHAMDWDRRPGRRDEEGEYVYDVQLGNVLFAGIFSRTHTRLTTMESANESARRAVNAILDAEDSALQRCQTWRLEEALDVADLGPARELDRRLYAQRARHAMDNLLTEGLLRALPFDLVRLTLPFERLRRNR